MTMQYTNGERSRLARLAVPALFACLVGCQGAADDEASDAAARLEDDVTLDSPSTKADPLQVKVSAGTLQGKLTGKARTFLGIPYAKPPVGALRFAPPQPADKWEGVKPVLEHGPSCPQNPGALSARGPQSEDCLSLKVYAPEAGKELPVMVWIHGGAFISGGSNQYDGVRLASEGPVVVVTLNYRLGALGFLSHPELDAARGGQPSGNDALRDQQLALEWVQKNIKEFGGDPSNVTVFGESAGSMSTCMHLVSPTSQKLASRFILESGSCLGGLPVNDKPKANKVGIELAAALCGEAADRVACLREKPAAQLVAWGADRGIFGAGWAPVADAKDGVLPATPASIIAAGKQNKGELIIGSNKNEWGLFLALQPNNPINSVATFDAAVTAQFGPAAPAIKQQYAPTDATANAAFVRVMTDATFRCPSRKLARETSAQGQKVYLYSFEEGLAFHAYEIPYVFGNPSAALAPTLVEPLRATVQSYWRSFAVDGDPNVDGQPAWPTYDAASDRHMTLKASSEVGSGLAKSDCDFWDKLTAATGT